MPKPPSPHDHDDLLAGTRELRADTHAEAVADGRERSGVDNLAGEAAGEARLIQPERVKLSMTTVAFLSSTVMRSLDRRAG